MELATLNLSIDKAQRNFSYRKGTADEAVILHALANTGFDLAPLRRAGELASLYERLVRTGKAPLIVDAGANIGASTVFFAFKFAKARLVAVEQDAGNFELLSANTADLPVECLNATVAADSAAAATAAARVSIDEIFERHAPATLPFIVKIDIERSGERLFATSTEWVARTPVVIIALSDSLIPGTAKTRAFVDFIAERNRDFVYVNDSIFSLDRAPAVPHADGAQTALPP